MKKREIITEVFEFPSREELPVIERDLITAAEGAARLSYSPYSRFSVGAALLLEDSTVVTGCNIENAAFPSGICAEHNAISTAAAGFSDKRPVAIAIVAMREGRITDNPVTPCGKCRQVIAEEEKRHGGGVKIIMAGREKIMVTGSAGALLPLHFSGSDIPPVE